MNCFRVRSWTTLLGFCFLSVVVHADQKEVTAESTIASSGKGRAWKYLLHLPAEYKKEDTNRWPLLLFLHGRSIRGNDLQKLKRYGPPQFLDRKPNFPFIVVSPQLPDGSWASSSLVNLLDEVIAKYGADPDRVYLTGTSLGAMGAWELAGAAPDKFAAFVPVCGYGGMSLAKKLTHVPIWAFHGDADDIVSIQPHRELIEDINKRGGQARLTVIPGGTHGSVIGPTYDNPEIYSWMQKQSRGQ